MSMLRNKTIATKVTEEECARLEQMADAAGQSMSEWSRQILLGQSESVQTGEAEQILLAEVLALRNILVNLAFAQHKGERLSLDDIRHLLADADRTKVRKAAERLEAGFGVNRHDVQK